MCVVGAKEVEANSLNIRTRASGELGSISLDEVIGRLQAAISGYGDF